MDIQDSVGEVLGIADQNTWLNYDKGEWKLSPLWGRTMYFTYLEEWGDWLELAQIF